MPIQYPVAVGTILLCDYSTGFREPEMVKRRPAVVVSPRLRHRNELCTIVPLSGTPPLRELPYQCRLLFDPPLPEPFAMESGWAKADMLATVAFHRLDLFRTRRDQTGKRKYLHPRLPGKDLTRVRCCILCALGLDGLTSHVP